jgi:hypothetical protein
MQKTLSILSLVLMCGAMASVAWYFGRHLPAVHEAEVADQHHKTDLANARKCDADSRKYYSNFVREHESGMSLPGWDINWNSPEIHYNPQTGACMMNFGSEQILTAPVSLRSQTPSIHRNEIIDVYEKSVVLYGCFERRPDGTETLIDPLEPGVPNYLPEDYSVKKRNLFGD